MVYCRSLCVLLSFFFWPLCCLPFDLQILITPLVSSNSSYSWRYFIGVRVKCLCVFLLFILECVLDFGHLLMSTLYSHISRFYCKVILRNGKIMSDYNVLKILSSCIVFVVTNIFFNEHQEIRVVLSSTFIIDNEVGKSSICQNF